MSPRGCGWSCSGWPRRSPSRSGPRGRHGAFVRGRQAQPAKDPVATLQVLRRSTLLRSLNSDHPVVAQRPRIRPGRPRLRPGGRGEGLLRPGTRLGAGVGILRRVDRLRCARPALYPAGRVPQAGPAGEASAELRRRRAAGLDSRLLLPPPRTPPAGRALKSTHLMVRTRRQQVGSIALFFGSFLAAVAGGVRAGPSPCSCRGAVHQPRHPDPLRPLRPACPRPPPCRRGGRGPRPKRRPNRRDRRGSRPVGQHAAYNLGDRRHLGHRAEADVAATELLSPWT